MFCAEWHLYPGRLTASKNSSTGANTCLTRTANPTSFPSRLETSCKPSTSPPRSGQDISGNPHTLCCTITNDFFLCCQRGPSIPRLYIRGPCLIRNPSRYDLLRHPGPRSQEDLRVYGNRQGGSLGRYFCGRVGRVKRIGGVPSALSGWNLPKTISVD